MGKISRRIRPNNGLPTDANRVANILRKQANAGGFIRFIDGDTANCNVNNLTYCSLTDAFANPTWTVDWDLYLSAKQTEFVHANMAKFAILFS